MADRPTEQQARPRPASTTRPPVTARLQALVSGGADERGATATPSTRGTTSAATKAATKAAAGRKPPRRARLRLTRVDPWSVMKTAALLSVALGIVTVVSVGIIWAVLGAAGVWESINSTVADVVGTEETSGFDVRDYVGTSRIIGFATLVSAINVVLLTAIATLGAFLYNMAAALLGGIELTLAEDEH
jgi:hypothetical protein